MFGPTNYSIQLIGEEIAHPYMDLTRASYYRIEGKEPKERKLFRALSGGITASSTGINLDTHNTEDHNGELFTRILGGASRVGSEPA